MPHQDGRIYTETRDGVKYGIDIRDIQQTLSHYSNDVGTLCSSEKINPYNRNKPVRHVALGPTANYSTYPYWYRGDDNSCGLNLTKIKFDNSFDTTRTLKQQIQAATNWKLTNINTNRKLPRGKATYNEFYRVLDFDGYDQSQPCPLVRFDYPEDIYYNWVKETGTTQSPFFRITDNASVHLSDYSLTAFDIMQYFSNKEEFASSSTLGYFGVIVVGEGSESDDRNYAFVKSFDRVSASTMPALQLDIQTLYNQYSRVFGQGSNILLAPCLVNINTNHDFVNVLSNNSLEIILWPSEIGAFRSYTLKRYVAPPPILYDVTVEFNPNPWALQPQAPSYMTVTITVMRKSGSVRNLCPSIFVEYMKYKTVTGGNVDSFQNVEAQWITQGGYEPGSSTQAVTTISEGLGGWSYSKTVPATFFFVGGINMGSNTRVTVNPTFEVHLELDNSRIDQRQINMTEDSQTLALSWLRN